MKQEIKNKFPSWCQDTDTDTDYQLVLSDDIDSLFSCIILNYMFDYKIKFFYNFKSYYVGDNATHGKCIGVDADLINGKRCWGNHVTLANANSANLNTILEIDRNNYTKKFAGSTLLTILSYYNVDISNCTEQQLEVLIAIDVAFKQYYFNKDLFTYYYTDILEYPQFVELLDKHKNDKEYFYNIIKEYGLHNNIYVGEDKQLHTSIKLDKLGEVFPKLSFVLPKIEFNKYHDFKIVQSSYLQHTEDKIFSCARTYKNALRYSII